MHQTVQNLFLEIINYVSIQQFIILLSVMYTVLDEKVELWELKIILESPK